MKKSYHDLIDVSKLSGGLLLRGLLPFYVLSLLAKKKMYGKQIIDHITNMTRGSWKPSPGSIYPMLQKMVKLGLVTQHLENTGGQSTRVYELTGLGREALKDMRKEIKPRLEKTIQLLSYHLQELEKD
ncbi:PadR family transcriptional regulator [Desulfolucanica intricata]|uniref:PadR family transcriptional regulator n=1 Tax=Desulfolucanica intricata TaxID=1285191 RepID=UPI0008341D93|nr:PadR family transcriptional regulator [Desulfolucanica intricata]